MKIIDVPKRILKIAHDEANKTDIKKARMSALAIDKRFNIFGKSFNVKILGHDTRFSIHAEHNLLIKHRYSIDTMLIYRVYKLTQAGSSRPCPKCLEFLRRANVKSIVFWENGNWIKEKI